VSDPGDLVGTELEHYRLDRVLGKGGMGVVYEATDQALRRSVAVKVLAPDLLDDQAARRRFQREIESAVAIEHPHVVPVYSAGYDQGVFFLVMRLVNGPNLGEALRACVRMEQERALRLLGQIASALHAVHGRKLIHRDIKPQNILVGHVGERDEHAVLTDFGIAKALDESSILTGVGVVGTVPYMAPELFAGGNASPASDQYALACVGYEVLSGQGPFDCASDFKEAHLHEEPRPLAELCPAVDPQLAAAIHRGLDKDPARRFDDVRDLVAVHPVGSKSFEKASAITTAVTGREASGALVDELAAEHDLSDSVIATVLDIPTAQVARLRRQAAREALLGPTIHRGPRRSDARRPAKSAPSAPGSERAQ